VDLSTISFMFCHIKYGGQLAPTAAAPVCTVQFLVRASPRFTFIVVSPRQYRQIM